MASRVAVTVLAAFVFLDLAKFFISERFGTGAVASVSVVTVANDLYGIEAGRTVDLTVVYLDLPRAWLAALPAETRDAISRGDAFPNFPRYDTFTQLDLTEEQVALLAHLGSWVIEANADLLRAKLADE